MIVVNERKKKKVIAWIAIGLSAILANFWAFWGINENFHEGWYSASFEENILMMFGQYLLLPIGFILLAFISIKWNRIGSICNLILAVGAFYLFGKMEAGVLWVVAPLLGLAVLYWFGKVESRRLAYFVACGLPLLQIVGIGAYHSIRIGNRYNDGNFNARLIKGNGVELIWAPQGPGWPDNGTTWFEAKRICAHLSRDGKSLNTSELNLWRLPTINEAVRSMVFHGNNAGGLWDSISTSATYNHQPDKESPLWNMHLKTIYWWTATEVSAKKADIIVYNGSAWPRSKNLKAGYLNFRAVRELK